MEQDTGIESATERQIDAETQRYGDGDGQKGRRRSTRRKRQGLRMRPEQGRGTETDQLTPGCRSARLFSFYVEATMAPGQSFCVQYPFSL